MIKTFEEFYNLCEKSYNICPWQETMNTRKYSVELQKEVAEVINAIDNNDKENIQEELGDVLLDWIHVCFHAKKEYNISMKDIIQDVHDKLNRRKPFVKENKKVPLEEAKQIWEDVKKWEKQQKSIKK